MAYDGHYWSAEETDTMRRLWASGLSAKQIAAQMDRVTRNAVLGRLWRMGLVRGDRQSRPPTFARIRRPKAAAKVKKINASSNPPRKLPAPETLAPLDPKLTVLRLSAFTCRYPIGDPQHANFAFCGRLIHGERPYCEGHCRIAYRASEKAGAK